MTVARMRRGASLVLVGLRWPHAQYDVSGIAFAHNTIVTDKKEYDMDAKSGSSKTMWIIIGVVVIAIMLVAGLLPLPGQKDNVTPHSQPSPSGTSPTPKSPTGPPTAPPPGVAPSSVPK